MYELGNQLDLAFKMVFEINTENGKTTQYKTGLLNPQEK